MVVSSLAALALVAAFPAPAVTPQRNPAAFPAPAVTLQQKLAALSALTQPTARSAAAWRHARDDRSSWAPYAFDWSTDLCSGSPDKPLGFDFTTPCVRHDFGYRNYKAVGRFPANKEHVDRAFLFDMSQVCATYAQIRRTACDRLARSYYQAVRRLGAVV
ncbi:putative secreted protein [[Actinomadura] parvosata subsp. kistnae]|uniref:Phospholipase n=1 Tax=[Actinomadura] parvosata subsp. kistnae TaxID=1909395 RepID=A0A1V0AE51_9ACTN|nr:phospholipase [Nonomuraea sp. ATCC 55076]AQZ68488.1 phospholipase [Nonomuraea sp. ATCC 55076]SPL93056.1 putative secreted protein [Actinomadura parvosata subsp. kistnae]